MPNNEKQRNKRSRKAASNDLKEEVANVPAEELDSAENDETSPQAKKTRLRKQVIFRRVVLDNQPLTIKELKELCDDASITSRQIERDIGMFEKVGCHIQLQKGKSALQDSDEIVFLEGPHTDDDTVREGVNSKSKALVAEMVAHLILGTPNIKPEHSHLLPEWMEQLSTARREEALQQLWRCKSDEDVTAASVTAALVHLAEKVGLDTPAFIGRQVVEIVSMLKHNKRETRARSARLERLLMRFWQEANRMVAIDSGTTNIVLARDYLAGIRIPMPGSPLCALTVCTNSRRIFEVLGHSRIPIRTVVIGGQQKFRSPTVCGAMAEQFLRSVSLLQFGMCILGATRLDLERFAICSDSQEESSIKTLLMERSSLKIVAIDNSKLQAGLGRTGYKFASIDPAHIDLIVTNSPLKKENSGDEEWRNFCTSVEAIQARGIPVLVATSTETYPHPYPQVEREGQD